MNVQRLFERFTNEIKPEVYALPIVRIPFIFILLTAGLWVFILVHKLCLVCPMKRNTVENTDVPIAMIPMNNNTPRTHTPSGLILNNSAYNQDLVGFKGYMLVFLCNSTWCMFVKIRPESPESVNSHMIILRIVYALQDFFILPLIGCILPFILYLSNKKLRSFVKEDVFGL